MNGNNELVVGQTAALQRSQSESTLLQQLGVGVVWLAVGGLIGWSIMAHYGLWTGQSAVASVTVGQYAAGAHRVFAAEDKHAVEVSVADKFHLADWLSRRVSARIEPPDLDLYNYTLLGGRLLPAKGQHAAQYMYEGQNNGRLTLFISSAVDNVVTEATRCQRSDDGVMVCGWKKKALAYYVVGDATDTNIAGLLEVAEHVRPQLPSL